MQLTKQSRNQASMEPDEEGEERGKEGNRSHHEASIIEQLATELVKGPFATVEAVDAFASQISEEMAQKPLSSKITHLARPGAIAQTIRSGTEVVLRQGLEVKGGLSKAEIAVVDFYGHDGHFFGLKRVKDAEPLDRWGRGALKRDDLAYALDGGGKTLLIHWAAHHNCRWPVLNRLLDINAKVTVEADDQGWTPLSLVARQDGSPTEDIIRFARTYPDAMCEEVAAVVLIRRPEEAALLLEEILPNEVENSTVTEKAIRIEALNALLPKPESRTCCISDEMRLLHVAVFLNFNHEVVKMILRKNPRAIDLTDALGRTPLVISLQVEASDEVIQALLLAHSDAYDACSHESVRLAIRCGFDAQKFENRLSLLQVGMFHPAAAIVLEEYVNWRKASRCDISFQEVLASTNSTVENSAIENAEPFYAIVYLLLKCGAEKEWLLGQASRLNTKGPARVLVNRFGAKGTIKIEELGGRSARDIGQASNNKEVLSFFKSLGSKLNRYQVSEGPAVHISKSCRVEFAIDLLNNDRRVALKHMKQRAHFVRELAARYFKGRSLDGRFVIGVVGWHCPAGEDFNTDLSGMPIQPEEEPTEDNEYKYILVMPCGERSLHDVCAKERLAGNNVEAIVTAATAVAQCIHHIHEQGLVHLDVKHRNIIRLENGRWCMCDMDASRELNTPGGAKSSTAYCAPELARARFEASPSAGGCVESLASLDVWSFGVVLFELSAGRNLWSQDLANDEIVTIIDRTRLCAWHTISDGLLEEVFISEDISEVAGIELSRVRRSVQHLIRWCLKGNPAERPTMTEILSHPFIQRQALPDPLVPPLKQLPMKYVFFLSHAQLDAASTAKSLFNMMRHLGVSVWYDMDQANLTLEGMKEGVRDSDTFLLVLTKNTLGRWYCQQEIITAIASQKSIQLVVEEDTRFSPFVWATWRDFNVKEPGQKAVICDAIENALPNAVTYRRRDYEADAMLQEICRRNNVTLPPPPSMLGQCRSFGANTATFIIYHHGHANDMHQQIRDGLIASRQVIVTDEFKPESEAKFLVLLSKGVLEEEPSRSQLEAVLQAQQPSGQHIHRSRFFLVYDPDNWEFGVDFKPQVVKEALESHEATSYRPQSSGPSRHEFPAFMRHLIQKLRPDLH